jgi:hypothetical protein
MTKKTLAIKGGGFRFFSVVFLALLVTTCQRNAPHTPAQGGVPAYRVWPSKAPADCPFPQSQDITGIAFTGRHKEYTEADTWYPSWASDGNMYSPYTDGNVDGNKSFSMSPEWNKGASPETLAKMYPTTPPAATTGQAKIIGDDPLNLKVVSLGFQPALPKPYDGRYPCGSLVYNGIWYYGTYGLDDRKELCGNCCVQGPFVGFRISRDYGKTWTQTKLTPDNNLFREAAKNGTTVKMGAPHFVDFGMNMEHSPDGKAYIIAHGPSHPEPKHAWSSGGQIFMARVTPSLENMNDLSKYEFYAGRDDQGQPKWSREYTDIKPLLEWNDHLGTVTATYNPALKKYLMCITHGWPTTKALDTMILESDLLTGPWKLVTYMEKFGEQAYFVNFPSKFISTDGRTAWLCYSDNYTKDQKVNLPGGRYGMNLQEVKLLSGDITGIPPMIPPPTQ